jgi:DNA-binding GntR family transcriptional regulator
MSIVSRIKVDLAERIRDGADLPAPLTLQAIARRYDVSVTPVRLAVAELIDDGVLLKGANRRIVVAPRNGKSLKTRVKSRGPTVVAPVDCCEEIAANLVRLSLAGEPIHLREEATAKKYGVSRSAIRNVFHRLAGEGMLDHLPRRGWLLRPFRQEDLRAFLDVREALELKALDLARERLRQSELKEMLDNNALPSGPRQRPRIDNRLHAYLIEKSANPYIADFFQRHGRYYHLLFDWEGQDRSTALDAVRQHRAILAALLDRDWPAARKALSHHIRCNHPILSQFGARSNVG